MFGEAITILCEKKWWSWLCCKNFYFILLGKNKSIINITRLIRIDSSELWKRRTDRFTDSQIHRGGYRVRPGLKINDDCLFQSSQTKWWKTGCRNTKSLQEMDYLYMFGNIISSLTKYPAVSKEPGNEVNFLKCNIRE